MLGFELHDVKTFLGYTDTTKDAQLELLIDAALSTAKSVLGRSLEYGVYRDIWQYHGEKHYLREYPVDVVLEVLDGTTIVDPTAYRLFGETGIVMFDGGSNWGPSGSGWVRGTSNLFYITYVGGYQVFPGELKMALFNSVQAAENYRLQSHTYGGPLKRLSVYDVGVTDFAVTKDTTISAVMRSALEAALAPYLERAASLGTWLLHETEYVGVAPGSPLGSP